IANLEYRKTVEASFALEGLAVKGGRVFQIAPGNLREAVSQDQPNVFAAREAPLTGTWRFPAGAVAAVELEVA
ncbi:MAG TPA: alpha-L-arabinofuranosidase, partial [Candidatus Solibacter sp.]